MHFEEQDLDTLQVGFQNRIAQERVGDRISTEILCMEP